ncbi:hypothetical protein C9413_08045 [Rhizobium sp. SEMIA 4085]|uniref:Uncharacterized protein n=1 Tax=Rhizobium gallicum bv. gallicum R602sp TaxID=1041138 RepID=A0A0B4X0G7_9HYPH|nr:MULTISPECIES: hypothetical protein [Rhizobium]AJD40270.1 hypothetical protein RGR602_CH00909 [Rhizobium gallicum bv. gallicum R602sp]NNH29449.1 hypothetical protein [Rhizobium sp. SEMIA 4085]
MIFAEFYRNACGFDGYNKARRFSILIRGFLGAGGHIAAFIAVPAGDGPRLDGPSSRLGRCQSFHGGDLSGQKRHRRKPFARNGVPTGMKMV